MNFPKRQLEIIIEQICNENKYKLVSLSEGWILNIKKKNKTMYILGYNFPNNSGSITKICDDKAGFSQILKQNNIKCFFHHYFMRNYYSPQDIEEMFNKMNKDVVVKPNIGSSGSMVFHCTTLEDLNDKISQILSSHIGFSISKFWKYENEYRAIILNGKIQTVYLKIRGENEWRHNLAQGAIISEEIDKKIYSKIAKLAKKIGKKININFCSIDFALLNNNTIYVVEGNSGVMMEKFSKSSEERFLKAKKIYAKAIKSYFKSI